MGDDKQASTRGLTHRNEAMLANRMTGVIKRCSKWIVKDSDRLVKGDPMLPGITLCFGAVPFKLHIFKVYASVRLRSQRARGNVRELSFVASATTCQLLK